MSAKIHSVTSLDQLTSLLAARPAQTRTRKDNPAATMRAERLQSARDGNVVNISNGEFYSRGVNKGQPMSPESVKQTYNRLFEDQLRDYGLVVHVISWDENENMLPENECYALLAPITA
jgi:hypothetical protein